MTTMTIEDLKKIIDYINDNYKIEFDNGKTNYSLNNKVEIDIELETLTLKKY